MIAVLYIRNTHKTKRCRYCLYAFHSLMLAHIPAISLANAPSQRGALIYTAMDTFYSIVWTSQRHFDLYM